MIKREYRERKYIKAKKKKRKPNHYNCNWIMKIAHHDVTQQLCGNTTRQTLHFSLVKTCVRFNYSIQKSFK